MARNYKAYTPEPEKPAEIDGTTTAEGLVQMGRDYAYRVPGKIHITDKGHALLCQQQRAKAREELAKGTWHGVTGKHPEPPAQPGYVETHRHIGGQRARARA